MRIRSQTRLAHTPQQFPKTRPTSQVRPQYQRVTEKSDQRLQFRARPIRDRRPHQNFLLPAVARQQHVEGRQQPHEQRHAFSPAQLSQLRTHLLAHTEELCRATMRLHATARRPTPAPSIAVAAVSLLRPATVAATPHNPHTATATLRASPAARLKTPRTTRSTPASAPPTTSHPK